MENPVAHISAISIEGASLEDMLKMEKLEQKRLMEKFPLHTHRLAYYVGGSFKKDSPEGIYLANNPNTLTVQDILAGN